MVYLDLVFEPELEEGGAVHQLFLHKDGGVNTMQGEVIKCFTSIILGFCLSQCCIGIPRVFSPGILDSQNF